MAKYSKNVLVFCIGMLLVSLWCMKVSGQGEGKGHEGAPVECKSKTPGGDCTNDVTIQPMKKDGGGGEKHENPFTRWFRSDKPT
ncbi:unnamed protein product [Lathyrus oleraceus]